MESPILKVYFSQMAEYPVLSIEEEQKLYPLLKRGGAKAAAARDTLVKHNLRLVISLAKKYRTNSNFEDIIAEGNIGLLQAAERFEPSFGAKFSVYAAWYIKQRILRHHSILGRSFRVPSHVHVLLARYHKLLDEFKQAGQEEPSIELIAEKLGITCKKALTLQAVSAPTVSLQTPLSDTEADGATLEHVIPDPTQDTRTCFDLKHNTDLLQGFLAQLTPRERDIISLRFGLGSREPATLETIGAKYKVTRERIRQIELLCFKKLRRLHRAGQKRVELQAVA